MRKSPKAIAFIWNIDHGNIFLIQCLNPDEDFMKNNLNTGKDLYVL